MPPFVGVAVNVTLAPAHIVRLPVVIAVDTEGVNVGLTVIVIPVLIAVVGVAQEALLVRMQVITSAFPKVVLV